MNKPRDLTRREFLRYSLGLGVWALLLYPLTRYWPAADKRSSPNISRHPASWYKRLAG
jgi:hypothetical protein